jgi:16S rRNA processing protein RimM
MVIEPSPGFERYRPEKGELLHLNSKKYQREFTLEYLKEIHGAPILKLQHIDSINDALKLVGYSVYSQTDIDESEDSLQEFIVKDLSGDVWGKVNDLMESGLNQLLEIESPDGNIIYVPFTEAIVKSLDRENKLIIIDPPDGLRDLNQ